MSGTSGRRSPTPFAFYNPASRSLRTSQTTFDLGLPTSSPTLLASGSMRSGALFAHRRSALPTTDDACSSSPTLPTPRARDSRGKGFADALPNVVALLPTPTASEATGPGHTGSGGMNLRHTVTLLPTPRASDGEKGGPNQRGSKGDLALPSAVVRLLPTPTATDAKSSSGANPAWGHGETLTDAARSVGAASRPPSRAGKPSSGGPLPGQLTLDID